MGNVSSSKSTGTTAHAGGIRSWFPMSRSWKIGVIVASVMVILAVIGVGLTTTNKQSAPNYWLTLVPIYGLLCVGVAWMRSRTGDGSKNQIIRQVIHWCAIACAIFIDFYIRGTGEETSVTAGYSALLLLALGCFLAGVHMEWTFSLVGLLLLATLILVVKAEQYLWLVVVVGLLIIVVMFALMRLMNRANVPQHGELSHHTRD